MSRILRLLRSIYLSQLLSMVGLLAVYSIFPISSIKIDFLIRSLFFIFIFGWIYKNDNTEYKKPEILELIILGSFIVFYLIRVFVLYPAIDDITYHSIAGDYARTYYWGKNYLAMGNAEYLYPLFQAMYTPWLEIVGFRLTILANGLMLILWFWTTLINYRILLPKKKWWFRLIYIGIFFYPYLTATHATLMADFLALILGIEMILSYQKRNYTWFIIFGILAIIGKQSTGIFLVPVFLYYFIILIKNHLKEIKIVPVLLIGLGIIIFFGKNYVETGNPLASLFNGIFKSSLYPLSNFKDPNWGPSTIRNILIWPVIGSFTTRFGEGWVSIRNQVLFSILLVLPFLLSTTKIFTKRNLVYIVLTISFWMWAWMTGYSRYHIPLSMVSWLIILPEIPLPKLNVNISLAACFIFIIMGFSTMETDYAWRPIVFVKYFSNPEISVASYIISLRDGLRMVGHDRISDLASYYKDDFRNYDVVVPIQRGAASFYSYLGYKNGKVVVSSVAPNDLKTILYNKKVSERLKNNLRFAISAKRVLLVVDNEFKMNTDSSYFYKNYNCSNIGYARKAIPFQRDYYFGDVSLYDCSRL